MLTERLRDLSSRAYHRTMQIFPCAFKSPGVKTRYPRQETDAAEGYCTCPDIPHNGVWSMNQTEVHAVLLGRAIRQAEDEFDEGP